jgi:hypothetical protein
MHIVECLIIEGLEPLAKILVKPPSGTDARDLGGRNGPGRRRKEEDVYTELGFVAKICLRDGVDSGVGP